MNDKCIHINHTLVTYKLMIQYQKVINERLTQHVSIMNYVASYSVVIQARYTVLKCNIMTLCGPDFQYSLDGKKRAATSLKPPVTVLGLQLKVRIKLQQKSTALLDVDVISIYGRHCHGTPRNRLIFSTIISKTHTESFKLL